ncbi:DUF1080 domain-containing protein [Rubrivirga sp. IMCC45206]|uniref:3-keto-disaccharide hydrolase n=1 Tax=Rubrivirga sp. IMCC45206 TaxID=3391614 RepID=UPI00398FEB61
MHARAALALLLLGPLAACGQIGGAEGRAPADAGWVDLFDGATLDGWHGYATADRSPKWSVVDGVMTLTPQGDWDGDLVAPGGPYGDFELEVEWWVQPCGNSGIFYRGEEDPALAPIWRTSLESQILDDTCHPDGTYPSHRAGGLYDLYTPETDAPTEGGAWHTTRIVADGDRITHMLDGRTVVDAVQGSADWDARIAVSKFRDGDAFPGYGTRRAGFVGLQDHGDTLRIRRVRIRTL